MTHETELAAAFVELTEALVGGRDLGAFLHLLSRRTVELLAVDAAGVMLADESHHLRAVAASDEETHLLEMLSLQHQEGLCIDVYRQRRFEQTLAENSLDRWPTFSRLAIDQGFRWLGGVPLRYADEVIGAMNLFRKDEQPLGDEDIRLAQALADVTTIALLQQRESSGARREAAQLQAALDSRVLVEQAKGVLAERLNISPDLAFQVLRREARNANRKLREVAQEIVHGDPDLDSRFTVP